MRELTKSLFSLTWALPLFGLEQAVHFARPEEWVRPRRTTRALDAVRAAAQDQLGNTLRSVFDAGDRLQRGTVDFFFGVADPRAWSDRSRRTGDAGRAPGEPCWDDAQEPTTAPREAHEGWGRVPFSSAASDR